VCWFEGWYRPDALRVKIREDGVVRNKAVYLALAVLPDGTREILGLWIEQTEGAKFWMKVFNELKTRGTQDVLIAVTDGLKGMEQALNAVFPATTLQTCILHLIRSSLEYASRKERRTVAAALRPIYTAATVEAALAALVQFEQGPGANATRRSQTHGHFPSDEAATKLLWLVLRNITGAWGSDTHDWKAAMNQFDVIMQNELLCVSSSSASP